MKQSRNLSKVTHAPGIAIFKCFLVGWLVYSLALGIAAALFSEI